MDSNYLIYLSFHLFKIAESFSDDYLLKTKTKNLVFKILTDGLIFLETKKNNPHKDRLFSNIDNLQDILFQLRLEKKITRQQFLFFRNEYQRLKNKIKKIFPPSLSSSSTKTKFLPGINQRQQKIIEILKQKNTVQVKDIKKIFPDISKRTIRRDFDFLIKKGLVKRVGQWNNISYQLS